MSRPQSAESVPLGELEALLERSADALADGDESELRALAAAMRNLGGRVPDVRLQATVFAHFAEKAAQGNFAPLWDLVLAVRLAAVRPADFEPEDAGTFARIAEPSPELRNRPGILDTVPPFSRGSRDSRNASETVGSVPQNLRPSLEFLDGSQNSGAVPGSWRRFPRSGERRQILGAAAQNSRPSAEMPGDSSLCPGSWREPRREPRVRELRLVTRDDEPLSD